MFSFLAVSVMIYYLYLVSCCYETHISLFSPKYSLYSVHMHPLRLQMIVILAFNRSIKTYQVMPVIETAVYK